MEKSEVVRLVKKHLPASNGFVFSVLEEVQERCRCLPEDVLRVIAEETQIPLSQLYAVATFYNSFSLEPLGKHVIGVCHGTACHVKGSAGITENLEKELGIEEGRTSSDGLFTLQAVRCLGCCSLAPVVNIDGSTHARVKQDKIREVIGDLRREVKSFGDREKC